MIGIFRISSRRFFDRAIGLICLLVIVSVQAGSEFDRGLLWRIERSGVPPSYLFGTMHSDHPSVVRLPAPVQNAFDQARNVTLEVTLAPEDLAALSNSMLIMDGPGLETILGSDLYQRSVQAMRAYGVSETMVARMKPWAVAVTLMTPQATSGVVLDYVLYQNAMRSGKAVDGLETVAEQMAVFDTLSREDQVLLLKDTLDNLAEIDKMLTEVRVAYLERDLKRLLEISNASMHDSDPRLVRLFNQRAILDRNHRMSDRLEARLQTGRHFIAVGALHLPGKEGLLNLLKQRGYRIIRVY